MAEGLVTHQDGNTTRLVDEASTSQTVLDRLEPELRSQFRAASALLEGHTYSVCWRITSPGAFLDYEGGDQGLVRIASLKPLLSI